MCHVPVLRGPSTPTGISLIRWAFYHWPCPCGNPGRPKAAPRWRPGVRCDAVSLGSGDPVSAVQVWNQQRGRPHARQSDRSRCRQPVARSRRGTGYRPCRHPQTGPARPAGGASGRGYPGGGGLYPQPFLCSPCGGVAPASGGFAGTDAGAGREHRRGQCRHRCRRAAQRTAGLSGRGCRTGRAGRYRAADVHRRDPGAPSCRAHRGRRAGCRGRSGTHTLGGGGRGHHDHRHAAQGGVAPREAAGWRGGDDRHFQGCWHDPSQHGHHAGHDCHRRKNCPRPAADLGASHGRRQLQPHHGGWRHVHQ